MNELPEEIKQLIWKKFFSMSVVKSLDELIIYHEDIIIINSARNPEAMYEYKSSWKKRPDYYEKYVRETISWNNRGVDTKGRCLIKWG